MASKQFTWRAVKSVAIETWPALAGKGSLGVVAHGVLVAPAGLALVDVFRQEQKCEIVDTEE